MKWDRLKSSASFPPRRSHYRSGSYTVYPAWARGRGGQRLKRVIYRLTHNGHVVGAQFSSARLAKAFAEEYDHRDRRGRRILIQNGYDWCLTKEAEWRHERMKRQPHAYGRPASDEEIERSFDAYR